MGGVSYFNIPYCNNGFVDLSRQVSHSDFVDKSQEAAAELVALRKSRRSSQGCSCVCFRADKLNVAKLRGELSKRQEPALGSTSTIDAFTLLLMHRYC